MTYTWTDGPELSILLVRENMRDYAAEVSPEADESYGGPGYAWHLYRDARDMSWGWSADRYHAKVEAEQALLALMETDRTLGDTE